MKKLKLHLDALRVESFAAGATHQDHRTVRAHDAGWTDPNWNMCQFNCGTTVRYTVCNTSPCL